MDGCSGVVGNEGIDKKTPGVGRRKDFSVKKVHIIHTRYHVIKTDLNNLPPSPTQLPTLLHDIFLFGSLYLLTN